MRRIIITGASGLLGRAIYKEFVDKCWNVLGFAYSRAKDGLIKVNLFDTETVKAVISDFKPDVIIHCAAERSPDKVESDYESSKILNVQCSKNLAELAGSLNAAFLYISTDYVFDGENPPFKESDNPNPLNKYGLTKWEGEKEVMIANPDSCILRVPVLYGNEEYISESAVSSLFKGLLKDKNCKIEVSNFEIRFPSHTSDIADICLKLIESKLLDKTVNSIFHWCGCEAFTKYEMSLILAEEFSLPYSHLAPINFPPSNVQCPRPKNTQLSCERLKNMGIGQHTSFRDGIKSFKKLLCPDT